MRRWIWLLAIAACTSGSSRRRTPSGDGVDQLQISVDDTTDDGKTGYYLHVRFRYVVPTVAAPDRLRLDGRVACQLGAIRRLEHEGRFPGAPGPRRSDESPGHVDMTPFLLSPLAQRPDLCDVEIDETLEYPGPSRRLIEVCARRDQPPSDGPCPPNPVSGDGAGAGFSVPALAIEVAPPDLRPPFPQQERLILDYTVQAHRQQSDQTWVEVAINCPVSGHDEVSHNEAAGLRPGEAFTAGQIKLEGRVPAPTEPCTVVFTALEGLDGPRTPIESFCYRERRVERGACS